LFRVYKTKPFARFARKARISEAELWRAAQRANEGIIDADLGGGVVKQRIARSGEGKSGGSRSILLFRKNTRAVFVYGFEKKDRAAIGPDELEAFRELANVILSYSPEQMAEQISKGTLISVEEPKENTNA
jgi:hypothetical protein